MKIIDICMACAYNSITTFLRDFNKKYGMTPKQMREHTNANRDEARHGRAFKGLLERYFG